MDKGVEDAWAAGHGATVDAVEAAQLPRTTAAAALVHCAPELRDKPARMREWVGEWMGARVGAS